MKRNKKGFTLIELLTVIIVIGIIALITIPLILNAIEKSRKGAFTRSAENVLKASLLYYSNSQMNLVPLKDIRFDCDEYVCISDTLDSDGNFIKLNADGDMGKGYVFITKDGDVEFKLQKFKYCAIKTRDNAEVEVLEESCEILDATNDKTPPEIKSINTIVGTNSIEVTVGAEDLESGIYGYSFSIDGTNYSEIQTNNVYKFEELSKDNEPYTVYVRVYNGTYETEDYTDATGMSEGRKENIELKEITSPIIVVLPEGWQISKTVTISYLEGEYTKEYSIDDGDTWNTYEGEFTIEKNVTIVAKISDGNNIVTTTYEISNIDTIGPTTVVLSANNDNVYSKTKNVTVTLRDTVGSGLAAGKFKYGWSTSTSAEPSSYIEVSTVATTGINETTFTANGSELTGDYYLWVVPVTYKDNVGRSNTTTVKSTGTFKFDNLGPVVTLGTATVTKDSITVPYASVDSNVGTLGSTTCVYGKTTSYGSTGTVSDGNCVMSNLESGTTYYYKITSTDSLGNSTADSVKTGSATTVAVDYNEKPEATITIVSAAGRVIPANGYIDLSSTPTIQFGCKTEVGVSNYSYNLQHTSDIYNRYIKSNVVIETSSNPYEYVETISSLKNEEGVAISSGHNMAYLLTCTNLVGTTSDPVSFKINIENFTVTLAKSEAKARFITVKANATTSNEIEKYEFRLGEDGEWIDNGTTSTYTFTELTPETKYTLYTRVTNSIGETKNADVTTTTLSQTTCTSSGHCDCNGTSLSGTISVTCKDTDYGTIISQTSHSCSGSCGSGSSGGSSGSVCTCSCSLADDYLRCFVDLEPSDSSVDCEGKTPADSSAILQCCTSQGISCD